MKHPTDYTHDELEAEIRRLADTPRITPAENRHLEACLDEFESRKARKAKIDAARAKVTDAAPGYDQGPGIIIKSAGDLFRSEARSERESSDLALRALDHVARDAEPAADMPEVLRRNPGYAERFRALADPAYGTGFLKLAAAGGDGSRALLSMTDEERQAFARVAASESRAMALSPDTAGGLGVPVLLDPSIILTNTGATGSLRDISRIVRGISDTYRAITSAGVTASWDGEGVEVSDDSPTLGSVDVTAYRGACFVPVSMELFDDYETLAEQMRRVLADARNRLEIDAFINGNGTSAPAGLVTRLDANTNVEVIVTTAGALSVADIQTVFAQLPARHRSNATWVMSLDVQNEIRSLGDEKLSTQTVDLRSDYGYQLLGRPVVESSAMPEFIVGSTGAQNILVCGDFQNYLIFDRLDARLEVIPHLFGTTNGRPTGQRGWFYQFRAGAEVVNQDAFRLLVNT